MIYVLGDIHGKWSSFTKNILETKKYDNSIIIHVGDGGIGFPTVLQKVPTLFVDINSELNSHNITLYNVRGNHDNPIWFDDKHDLSNLKFVKDNSVLNIEDKNILTIGGATSVDRCQRTKNVSWWENEKITYDIDKIKKLENIDYVITHSCPFFCPPYGLTGTVNYWNSMEQMSNKKFKTELLKEISTERNYLDKVYDNLYEKNKIKGWFYGHMHMNNVTRIDEIEFIALNELQIINLEK